MRDELIGQVELFLQIDHQVENLRADRNIKRQCAGNANLQIFIRQIDVIFDVLPGKLFVIER